jgi:hypothetical protein
MKTKLMIALACTAALFALPASAAILITQENVTIDEGPPFAGGGANNTYVPTFNNSEVNPTTVTGDLNSGPTVGPLVTFSSTDNLSLFGSSNGFAQIEGPFSDLSIDPNFLFTAVDFALTTGPGASIFADVEVLLNGGSSVLFNNVELLTGNNDRFRIYGTNGELFTGVNFTFNAPVNTLRQVQFQTASVNGAVPEPSTWAMLLVGFGAVGGALRRKKSAPRLRLQVA